MGICRSVGLAVNVVGLLCARITVMNMGKVVEQGAADQILSDPQMEFTKFNLAAIPHFSS
jgi:peptide/nickel transport system ATP-binding protein